MSGECREQEHKSATEFTDLMFSMHFLNFKEEFWSNTAAHQLSLMEVITFGFINQ